MVLERKAWNELDDWLRCGHGKAVLVKGARQVGKSYLVDRFAEQSFPSVAKFDLLENAAAKASFSQAQSAEDLMFRISVASTTPLKEGETAIVIDEIQECPNILTYLKYLVQEGKYRFLVTGSLLGIMLENIDSLPVGYVRQIDMHPLDFEEFCWANGMGAEGLALAASCLKKEEALPDFLYERLLELYHRYLMVGGMPDAVKVYLSTTNIDEVRQVHRDLHSLYRTDITKYAPRELRLLVRDIYNLIPSEVTAQNKRFRLSSLKDVKRYDQVQQHFLWLANAGVALPVYNVVAPIAPLLVNEQRNLFKLFYLDAGMLSSTFPKKAYEGLLDGKPSFNMGRVYEAFVAQEIASQGFDLRYCTSKKIGEIDFLLEREDGTIDALEVKSGSAYMTHRALDNALAVKEYTVDRAVVLAETNVHRKGRILYAPVFLAGMLPSL